MSQKFFSLFAVLSLMTLSGCALEDAVSTNSTGGTEATPTATTIPDGGEVYSGTDFKVEVVNYEPDTIEVSKDGLGVSDCVAVPSSSSPDLITCIIDVEELDLHYHGLTIRDHTPNSSCEYRRFHPYYYAVAPVLSPPMDVAYTVDDDENVTAFSFGFDAGAILPDGSVAALPTYYCSAANPSANCTPTDGSHVRVVATGLPHMDRDGNLAYRAITGTADTGCPYDYSTFKDLGFGEAPGSCCRGSYTLTVTDPDATTTTAGKWDGKESNCYRGPGMSTSDGSALPIGVASGLPGYLYTYLETSGVSNDFKITEPLNIDTTFSHYPEEQVYASNYYSSSAVTYPAIGSFASSRPIALRLGFPYFRYDCLDSNEEVLARIDVQIREWNTKGQLLLGISGGGNPDVTGVEAGSGESNNDYSDWDDLGQDFLGFPD